MLAGDRGAAQCLLCTYKLKKWLFAAASHNRPVSPSLLSIECIRRRRNLSSSQSQRHQLSPHFKINRRKDGSGLQSALPEMRERVRDTDLVNLIVKRLEILTKEDEESSFLASPNHRGRHEFSQFRGEALSQFALWNHHSSVENKPAYFDSLRRAYLDNDVAGLDAQLKFVHQGTIANRDFSTSDILNQARLADLRYPAEWYPATRQVQRTIHLHVGPTNSGKTYHALQRLEQAKSGVYAGPLRLLAHEVYTRLNAKGKPCSLVTGDERQFPDGPEIPLLNSCTVEMMPINRDFDVAVIDEIQMIGNKERGWAWTSAFLGVKAKEVHLCGEERVIPLIRELTASMGERLEIHRYQRLSPLRAMTTSLRGDLRQLRKGDCVVSFSRVGIHALRREIENITGKRVAVVYGNLPPETRAEQARLFNDPNNDYDILVASDAIGMGLNLSIKRIIFETTRKWDGIHSTPLTIPQIKQIAGRAGRYRTAAQSQQNGTSEKDIASTAPSVGMVTSLESIDLPIITKGMKSEAEPIMTAGLFPPDSIIQHFATYFPPETHFSYILLRLHELSRIHPRFHLCILREQIGIADIIQPVEGLTIGDRNIFCVAPVALRDPGFPEIVKAFAQCVANQRGGALLEIPGLDLEILDSPFTKDRRYLRELEATHKSLVLYIWLSYRFAGVFTSRSMAFYVKRLLEEKIDTVLKEFSSHLNRQKLRSRREASILRDAKGEVVEEGNTDGKLEGANIGNSEQIAESQPLDLILGAELPTQAAAAA